MYPVQCGSSRAGGRTGAEGAFEAPGCCSVLAGNNTPLKERAVLMLPCRHWKLCSCFCAGVSAPG